MKYFKIILISLGVLLLHSSCDRDLPYPDRNNSVAYDITKVTGTKDVIDVGSFDGDYKIRIFLPEILGDPNLVEYAQISCVFYPKGRADANAVKDSKSAVIFDKVIDFMNNEFVLDFKEVYKVLGVSGFPELGQQLIFTTNVILKDGNFISGRTTYKIGDRFIEVYNNNTFSAWIIEDIRRYSAMVSYSVK